MLKNALIRPSVLSVQPCAVARSTSARAERAGNVRRAAVAISREARVTGLARKELGLSESLTIRSPSPLTTARRYCRSGVFFRCAHSHQGMREQEQYRKATRLARFTELDAPHTNRPSRGPLQHLDLPGLFRSDRHNAMNAQERRHQRVSRERARAARRSVAVFLLHHFLFRARKNCERSDYCVTVAHAVGGCASLCAVPAEIEYIAAVFQTRGRRARGFSSGLRFGLARYAEELRTPLASASGWSAIGSGN